MADKMSKMTEAIRDSLQIKKVLLNDTALHKQMEEITRELVSVFQAGGKVLFCGNGGSAADAQHLAAELSGRFYLDRPPLFAEALHVNTSFLTAVANDYGYDKAFARMVGAAGKQGDVLFAMSTSGNSPNILAAVAEARKIGLKIIGMTGSSGGALRDKCDWLLNMPSDDTPRIQEAHMLIGHIICAETEARLFGANTKYT